MKKINSIIKPLEGFQYSVNIAYDIYDDKKIGSYIPTSSSMKFIEDILLSTDNKSTDRARILTGSYGKGKSHLVLYTLSLLSGHDSSLFLPAIAKAKKENPNLANNIEDYIHSKKKLLPVIVNATSMNIKSALLQSLNLALDRANLMDTMPTTFFDVAIEKIVSWKEQFNETYLLFEKKVGETGDSFIAQLKNYNQSYFDLFVKIYPSLTSGSEFNPLMGSDVIDVYDSVCNAIRKKGYNGIFVVYDEFGKFLEGSVEKYSAMDIKLIQDFAEKCNRSGANQIHMLLISHKGIDNYIGRLPKIKVDAWKAVANRFKAVSIENSESEIYDIIATVLSRDTSDFEKYFDEHKEQFLYLKNLVEKSNVFNGIGMGEDISVSCYPLHPYSTLMLPIISEMVAQNERTIFTFLSSTEKNSIPYFLRISDSEFPIVEPDYIYDYFEPLFKGEPYGSSIKKQWQIVTSALSKLREYDNPLAEKIVKTLALIYCINDFDTIPPSWDLICDIYSTNYAWVEIESAKQVLQSANLLIELLYKPYVRITEGSRHNVIELIQQEKYRIESKTKASEVLNAISKTKYLYPVQYNDENEIIRYFDFVFIEKDTLCNIAMDGMQLNTTADGIVYAVLVESEQDLEYVQKIVSRNHNQRVVFIVPFAKFDATSIAQEYMAISNLISLYENQEIELIEELEYILEDRINVINAFIDNVYCRFDKHLSRIVYMGEEKVINRKTHLLQLLSQIVANIYNRTPKIVNELINRNEISSTVKNARNKILSALFAENLQADLGLLGNGPELNIMRSMLVIPGILVNEAIPHLDYIGCDSRFRDVLTIVKDHILLSSNNEDVNIGDLYNELINPEYGFGLKRGVIPVFLAIAFNQYKEHIVIRRKDREYPISASLLCDIDYAPAEYKVLLEEWDEDKDTYIAGLESIFSQFINSNDRSSGAFVYIVKAMRRWYLQLTKFEVTTKLICDDNGVVSSMDESFIKVRNALSNSDINAHEFLFITLPKILNTEDLTGIVRIIRQFYLLISLSYKNWTYKYIHGIKQMLGGSDDESLASVIANFYDDLKPQTREHLFNGKVNMFMGIAKHPNNDETKLVETIARALYNLRMSDFNDNIMCHFIDGFKLVIDEILSYNALNHSVGSDGSYKISFVDDNGDTITKQFDGTNSTDEGDLLYNDITSTLSEYGEAVTSDEKRQILFRILKELM